MSNEKKKLGLRQLCCWGILLYLLGAVAFYLITEEQLSYREQTVQAAPINSAVGEIAQGVCVLQTFRPTMDQITQVNVPFATYQRENRGILHVKIYDMKTMQPLLQNEIDISMFKTDFVQDILFGTPIVSVKNKLLGLEITSDAPTNGALAVYANENIAQSNLADAQLTVNGVLASGVLSISLRESEAVAFTQGYFVAAMALGLLLGAYCLNLLHKQKTGKRSLGLSVINAIFHYQFLLQQLIARDFKSKYKRSILGVFWSFLNPLLTMSVQYIVFSTLFQQDIPNFPVYLLSGVVFFNFFNEATGMGLSSIVGNASLITKVYIPKYIFPISRVFSSGISLLFSLVPLLLMALFTNAPLNKSFFLLLFPIACTFVFCIGMSMLFSTIMVFFRDMQFLWSVISMLWMYATPIFYPESIIPEQFLIFIKMNPMYHFIRFVRSVILSGASPDPRSYFLCLIAAVIPFMLGVIIFKKTQDKFVLYI